MNKLPTEDRPDAAARLLQLPPICEYADISSYFGISERTLYREVKRGALHPDCRTHGMTRFARHEVCGGGMRISACADKQSVKAMSVAVAAKVT